MPVDEATKLRCNDLSNEIISAAIEVHRHMGPGLLESAYRTCLCHEFGLRNISYRFEIPLDVEYKGLLVPQAYRIDIWVEELVLIEIKSVTWRPMSGNSRIRAFSTTCPIPVDRVSTSAALA